MLWQQPSRSKWSKVDKEREKVINRYQMKPITECNNTYHDAKSSKIADPGFSERESKYKGVCPRHVPWDKNIRYLIFIISNLATYSKKVTKVMYYVNQPLQQVANFRLLITIHGKYLEGENIGKFGEFVAICQIFTLQKS